MAELVLSFKIGGTNPSVGKLKGVSNDVIRQAAGVKIFPNDIEVVRNVSLDQLKTKRRKEMVPFTAAIEMVRASGTQMVFLDSRGAEDSVDDMYDRYKPIFREIKEHRGAKPTYIGLHYSSLRKVHEKFIDLALNEKIEPVCITTSSRATDVDYQDIGMKPYEYAAHTTRIAYELGYRTVQCAAVDAPVVKHERSDMAIFGTGIVLDMNDAVHERRVLPENVAPCLQYGVVGSAVVNAERPIEAAKCFQARLQTA
jgi:hypothetical protein